MQKNLIIAVLSLIILVTMLWPSKKPPTNQTEESLSNNDSPSHINAHRIPPNTLMTKIPGNNYTCPTPPSYNPQYPIPNPWYVTPQIQSNQMEGQPLYPQQSQLPNNFGYQQPQYYLPNYRFRNPNNNGSQYPTGYNNSENTPQTYPPFWV